MPNVIETSDAAAAASTSYSLLVGQSVRGTLSATDRSDWFRIDLIAGRTYTFAMIGTGVNDLPDPFLTLRNAAGAALLTNDDTGPGLAADLEYFATSSGSYYIDAGAVGAGVTGQYGLSVAEGARARYDVEMGAGALDRDEVSWSPPGTPTTVTFGFRQTAPTDFFANHPTTQTTFAPITAAQRADILLVMNLWSDVAGISFSEVNPGGFTNSATILFSNYADANDGSGAFANYPGSTARAGDVYLNTSVSRTFLPFGSYSHETILHEVGHAIGLAHPGEYNAAPGVNITYPVHAQFTEDSGQYSVMSYFDESVTAANYAGGANTPLMFDIYALQQLYGANTTTRTQNTRYGFGSTAGAVYDFAVNPNGGFCIWDAGGTDTLDCSSFGTAQTIDLNDGAFSGVGSLRNNVSIAVGAYIENAVGGSGDDVITGNSLGNDLRGGVGHDRLDGGVGGDFMFGGPGNDEYRIDDVWDGVLENANEGTDTIITSVNLRLSSNIENATVAAGSTATLTGNDLANRLTGNALGGELHGLGGNDTLDGGAGGDLMAGGIGDDFYFLDDVWDGVLERPNEGLDMIQSSVSLRLGAEIEYAVLAPGTGATTLFGNVLDNRLWGNQGANTLDGLGGADLMLGWLGDDVYHIDNVWDGVIENPGEGVDMIVAAVDLRLGANIENGALAGAAVRLDGNALNNVLVGSERDNILVGGAGHDTIIGARGADTMIGDSGNDAYFIDDVWDAVLELAGQGSDLVVSTVNLRLGLNIEDGALAGSATTLFGNALNNTLAGNELANALDGEGGSDTITGGGGADRFRITVAGQGIDTISDFTRGMGGDVLDLRDMLVGYSPGTSAAASFVRFTDVAGGTNVSVNTDGLGTDFVQVALLQGHAGIALNDMLAQSNLALA